jgi:plastocyanin
VIWRTALFLLIFINAGCHSKAGLKDSRPDTVTYIAHDESFAGPTNIAAGHITVRLVNEGEDPHHIQFIKLPHGKTADDLIAAIKTASSVTPVWARYAGGPNAVVGNETSEATIDLEAGEYVVVCQVPDRQGRPHFARGMIKPVRVTSGPPARGGPTKDSADAVVRAVDFRFNLQQPLQAGRQRIRLVNRGSQPHELVVIQLMPNATLKDFVEFLGPKAAGPAPGRPIGGITGLEQDEEGSFPVNLAPGHYGLICFLPDAAGVPHFAKGMTMEFDVE